jgi:hypothetical protein
MFSDGTISFEKRGKNRFHLGEVSASNRLPVISHLVTDSVTHMLFICTPSLVLSSQSEHERYRKGWAFSKRTRIIRKVLGFYT